MSEDESKLKERFISNLFKNKLNTSIHPLKFNKNRFNRKINFRKIMILMLVILNLNGQIITKLIDNIINISKSSIIHLKIYGKGNIINIL